MKKKKPIKKSRKPSKKKAREKFDLKAHLRRYRYVYLLLLVGFLLRFVDLGRQSLWIDEMCCWNDAHSSYERIMRTVHETVFLLERACLAIGGDHEYFLRIPSAFGGLLSMVFIYLLSMVLFDNRKAALFALILMTFSPINIYYSQDANYYGLMMGLTAASLYFLFRFMKGYNPLWLVVYGVVAYINYHVHPANILLIGCQLPILAAFLILDPGLRRKFQLALQKLTQNKIAFASAGLVLLVIIGFFGYRFFRFVHRMTFQPSGTVLSENLSLTPEFFKKLAMDYGVAFQQYSVYVFILTLFFLVFFIWGLVYAFRKMPYFAVFALFSWTLPFIAIYIKKIGHFYHCRYTSFIVPGYLVLAGCGIHRIGAFFENRWNKKASRVALFAAFGVVALGMATNLFRYYTGEKQDWKGAVNHLKKHLEPGEKVTSNIYCNNSSLEFYFNYYDMDLSPIEKLAGEFRGASYTGLFRLKKLCFTQPGVYFALSYTRYEDPRLWNWMKTYGEEVFHAPSLHPDEFNREGKEVIVYKFKYSGSFVFPPYRYYYEPDSPVSLEESFTRELLFEAEGDYRIGFEMAELNPDAEYLVRVEDSDGSVAKKAANINAGDGEEEIFAHLPIPKGLHTVSLVGNKTQGGGEKILGLSIQQEIGDVFHREAEDTDLYHPTPWKRVESVAGSRCFTLERNNYVYYDHVPFPKDGTYGFTLRALEDAPGPALIEVAMDWEPLGLLFYSKGDDSWTTRTFPFEATRGEHVISFHFLSPPGEIQKLVSGKMPSDRSQDTDARLDYFEIHPFSVGHPVPDMRAPISKRLVPVSDYINRGYEDPKNPGKLAKGWNAKPPYDYTLENGKDRQERTALQFEIPWDSKGFNLFSPAFPVKPGYYVYFSTWLKVERLSNHTANMRVVYLDKNNQTVGMNIVNADGITGTEDWVRQVYLSPAPPGASRAVILFWVYPNSRRYGRKPGFVTFDRIKMETLP